MEEKRAELIRLINLVKDDKVYDYLISFVTDFLIRYGQLEEEIEETTDDI